MAILTVLKGLRKSFKEKKSPHTSISSPITNNKTSVSSINDIHVSQSNMLQSPKRVIKALYDYKPQGPGELEFQKGDFFHVIGNEDDNEWYEACNPSKNLRGMVPVPYFEVFGKTTRTVSSSSFTSRKVSVDSRNSNNNTLYAVVLYEFKAERSDELDIHIGENIILCAHHNYEWFIAKPIDRLGGPGLVPVSYVSIINILTGQSTGNDVNDDINSANLPTVEEWKNKNAKYKASSIPLGNVDENDEPLNNNYNNNSHNSNANNNANKKQLISNDTQVNDSIPYIVDASVESFHVDNGRYWFKVFAKFSNNKIHYLCRYYEDFYDFQIQLLELFPNEAGKSVDSKRILPFIPGPLTYVTDKITQKRTIDLNDYIKELIFLPSYISHSNFVKSLFELRNEFDYESDSKTEVSKISRVESRKSSTNSVINQKNSRKNSINVESVKLKFYYKDDIFALLIPSNINILELREKISQRIYDNNIKSFKIFVKNDQNDEILNNNDLSIVLKNKLKILIDDE